MGQKFGKQSSARVASSQEGAPIQNVAGSNTGNMAGRSIIERAPIDMRREIITHLLPSEIDNLRATSKFLKNEEGAGAVKDVSARNRRQRPAMTMGLRDNMRLLQDISGVCLNVINQDVPEVEVDLNEGEDADEVMEQLIDLAIITLENIAVNPRHLTDEEVEAITALAFQENRVMSVLLDTLESVSENFLKLLKDGNTDFRNFSTAEAVSLIDMASKDEAVILAIAEGQNTLNFTTLLPADNKTVEIIKAVKNQIAGKDIGDFDVDDQSFYTEGRSLIHYATIHNLRGNVAALLVLGADPDLKDQLGKAPLHNAVINKDIETITMLAEGGADLNIKDQQRNTPLFSSVLHIDNVSPKDIEVTTYLLDAGAEVNERCQGGRTALTAAKGHVEMVNLLKQYGAKAEIKSDKGENALMYAAYAPKTRRKKSGGEVKYDFDGNEIHGEDLLSGNDNGRVSRALARGSKAVAQEKIVAEAKDEDGPYASVRHTESKKVDANEGKGKGGLG